jgi:short subunit dehydrogenase-like uncharacterized protein
MTISAIAVHGATGYTGRLVVAELARRGVTPVLVGRDPDRLNTVTAPGAERRVADLSDPTSLRAAFQDCAVVVNCAGPFAIHGEPVIRAAIDVGAHYVDISGEQSYVMRVFDHFDEPAERAGVTVVPMANDGGFLADLLAAVTAARIDPHDPIDEVVLAHRTGGGGGLSRGSGRTALLARDMFAGGGLVYVDGRWRADLPATCTAITFPGDPAPSTVAKAGFAEIATVPRHVAARRVEGVAEITFLARLAGLTPDVVERLPESPPEHLRTAGRFTLVAEVTGRTSRARGVVEGTDTYGTTAVVAVQAACQLVVQGACQLVVQGACQLVVQGAKPGVLAPAQAFTAGPFLDSLTSHGIRHTVETG